MAIAAAAEVIDSAAAPPALIDSAAAPPALLRQQCKEDKDAGEDAELAVREDEDADVTVRAARAGTVNSPRFQASVGRGRWLGS